MSIYGKKTLSFFKKMDADGQLFLACSVNNEFYLRIANKNKNWLTEPAFPFQDLAKYILKNTAMESEDIRIPSGESSSRIKR